jgi:pimeloyl-ACP methyl ester carboxylesterase
VHYIRAGAGVPALVFVHGYTCDHSDWQAQFEALKPRHEVVACDLRAHGETPGRAHECSIEHYGGDVAALLANFEFTNAILIGHSMGCRVVLEAARLDPERIGGVVLVDGSRMGGSGDPEAAEQAALAAIASAGGYRAWVEPLVAQMFLAASALSRRIIERALKLSPEVGTALWGRQLRWDAANMDAALAHLRAPLMVIQSTWINPERQRLALAAGQSSPWLELVRTRVPAARVEILAGLGHFPQIETPERVNRLIAEFAAARR